ncbi:MAG: terminase large subunit [bacterium]|nr:terminase large subunit [bacterium]
MTNCKEIDEYMEIVRKGTFPCCKEQKQLCRFVEKVFRNERLTVDREQLDRYMALQKYFEYELFPWEKFVFALHNCVYDGKGMLRWPDLLAMIGRGAGKNGYLAFEDFALLTPVNGIREYNIDIFANSEDQAKMTFMDIYGVLENNKAKMAKHFKWNLEEIKNLKTNSRLRFRTSNPKTKDGGRPGKVDFDEYHQYEDYKTIEVAKTGLGKKEHPRTTIVTTNGNVRDGPLDHILSRAEGILAGNVPDNGLLPFICRLDDKKEVDDKRMWHKANPSLRYFPTLQNQMEREYADYVQDNLGNSAFLTKRMNRPVGEIEDGVTDWENIAATAREIPCLKGRSGIGALDYAKTDDFVAAGILFELENYWYWITHSWVCRQTKDWSRIKFPIEEAAAKGYLTIVNDVEVQADLVAEWFAEMTGSYNIVRIAYDGFRHTWVEKALRNVGFDADKDGRNNIVRIYTRDIIKTVPLISSQFVNRRIIWGENPLMRWYTRNTKQKLDARGNVTYEKIEPKSRKTDGFMAFAAAATQINGIQGWNDVREAEDLDVYTY